MPKYSDYSLYGTSSSSLLSPLSYGTLLYHRGGGISVLSGLSSTSNYYNTSSGRNRYSPLLPTIKESGLSPTIGRRTPRSPVSYPTLYSPRSTPVSYVARPIKRDTDTIDVSSPRQLSRPQVTAEKDINDNNGATRSTIKRGRTVVRIHTKREVKKEQDDSYKNKMSPGERLKEKFLIKDSPSEALRRRKYEEDFKLKEIEKEESEKRLKRLMLLEDKPINFSQGPPIIMPDLIPVQPEISTITDDLDDTPKNSSDEDTDTEGSSDSSIRKKKCKRPTVSRKSSTSSIPEEDIPPLPPPRGRRKSDQWSDSEEKYPEKRDTIKRKMSRGVSKKKTLKLSKKIETKIIPEISSPSSPKLFIENIVVEEQRFVMLKIPPKGKKNKKSTEQTLETDTQNNKKASTAQKDNVKNDKLERQSTVKYVAEKKSSIDKNETKEITEHKDQPESTSKKNLDSLNKNADGNKNKEKNAKKDKLQDTALQSPAKCNEDLNTPVEKIDQENSGKEDEVVVWNRRESRMDWEWPEEETESIKSNKKGGKKLQTTSPGTPKIQDKTKPNFPVATKNQDKSTLSSPNIKIEEYKTTSSDSPKIQEKSPSSVVKDQEKSTITDSTKSQNMSALSSPTIKIQEKSTIKDQDKSKTTSPDSPKIKDKNISAGKNIRDEVNKTKEQKTTSPLFSKTQEKPQSPKENITREKKPLIEPESPKSPKAIEKVAPSESVKIELKNNDEQSMPVPISQASEKSDNMPEEKRVWNRRESLDWDWSDDSISTIESPTKIEQIKKEENKSKPESPKGSKNVSKTPKPGKNVEEKSPTSPSTKQNIKESPKESLDSPKLKWDRRESRMDWVWPEDDEEGSKPRSKIPPKRKDAPIISPKTPEIKTNVQTKLKKIPEPLKLNKDIDTSVATLQSPKKLISPKVPCSPVKKPPKEPEEVKIKEEKNPIEEKTKTDLEDRLSKINAFLQPKQEIKPSVDDSTNKKSEEKLIEDVKKEEEKKTDLDDRLSKINAFLLPKQEIKPSIDDSSNIKSEEKLNKDVKKGEEKNKTDLEDRLSKINAFLQPKQEIKPKEKSVDNNVNIKSEESSNKDVKKEEEKNKSELDDRLSKINAFLQPKQEIKPSTDDIAHKKSEEKLNADVKKEEEKKKSEIDDRLSKINAFLQPKPEIKLKETGVSENKIITSTQEKLTKNKEEEKSDDKKKSELEERLSKINSFLQPKQDTIPIEKSDGDSKIVASEEKSHSKKEEKKNSELEDKLSKINAFLQPKQEIKQNENKTVSAQTKQEEKSKVDDKISKINAWLQPQNKTDGKSEAVESKATVDDKISKINSWLQPKSEEKTTPSVEKTVAVDDKINKINAWLQPKNEKVETKINANEKINKIQSKTDTSKDDNKLEIDDKLSKINAWLKPKEETNKAISKSTNIEEKTEIKDTADKIKVQKNDKAAPKEETKKCELDDKLSKINALLQHKPEVKTEVKTDQNKSEPSKKIVGKIKENESSAKPGVDEKKKTSEKDMKKSEKPGTSKTDKSINESVTEEDKESSPEQDDFRATIKSRGTVKLNKKVTKTGKKDENKTDIPEPEEKNKKSPEVKQEEEKKTEEVIVKDKENKTPKSSKGKKTLKKKESANDEKTIEKKPNKINFPAPTKPLFMTPKMLKLLENKDKPIIKPLRRFKEAPKPVPPPPPPPEDEESSSEESSDEEPPEPEVVAKKSVRQIKFIPDRISTVRHMALKTSQSQSSVHEEDSDEESTSSGDDSDSSGSDTETEDNQNKPDRTSTSSEDSGIGSTHTSPLTTKQECSVNCHRKCEKHMPNLCGVNQKLLAEALSSLKKGRTNPGSTKNAAGAEAREGVSPARRLSTSFSSDSESGDEGRRYTPPAKTIPRFRKYAVDDFQFLKVLGKGSFGKVLLAELRSTDCYYAVKCLKKDVVLEDDDVECTLIERKVLALGTRHPYLCHLFCTFQTESHLFFVMEYLNGGDLMFHIQQSGRFEQARACFYAAEIVSGLKFLHKKGIVYRDLKLDNILLDYEGHVRIADFGMCKLQIYLDRTADTFCGTPDYMAPEIIKGLHYNQCVDWWSFGVLLYEMLIGQSPFNGCDEDELFWSICNEQPYYPRFLSKESQSILMLLLDKDSSRRLGTPDCPAGDVYHQAFFKTIDWQALDRKELEPPFKPRVLHALDVQYFDSAFTQEAARLTPVDKEILQSMDQSQFHGFSYTNPNACNE